MKINVELQDKYKEIEIVIKAAVMDSSVNAIIEKLQDEKSKKDVDALNEKIKKQ